MTQHIGICVSVFLILAAALSATALGQGAGTVDAVGGPFTGPPVLEAPFSADATTTLTETLADGAQRTQSATARYYRDAAGRVRVEQMVRGVKGLNPTTDSPKFITVDSDPGDGLVYTLNPRTRHVHPESRGILGRVFTGGSTFAIPVDTPQFRFRIYLAPRSNEEAAESLGNRTIEGVQTNGRRITTVVPIGRPDSDGRLEIVDERWVSPELKVVIYARTSDPVTGVFEYRLTNIRRGEPSPDLFRVPEEYTIDGCHCPLPDDPCFISEPLPQANRQWGRGPIVQ